METPQKNASGLYEQVIMDRTYLFTPWPIRVWLDRYAMLMGVAGEFLARLITAANNGAAIDEDMIGRLVEALMRNLGKDRAASIQLIEALCSDLVFVDGKKVNFALEFAHEHLRLHLVCAAAVAVQFGPLYEGMAEKFGQARSKAPSTEQTSNEASGPSSTPA